VVGPKNFHFSTASVSARLRHGVPLASGSHAERLTRRPQRDGVALLLLYRPAGGTFVSTKGGSFCRGVVRSFMGCSLMPPGELGALALFPTVSASRFIRLLTM
jgi:hypothetical protein